MNGDLQNNIPDLPSLAEIRYENIFNVYTTQKGTLNLYYFYNILNKVIIPDSIDQSLILKIKINGKLPWTTLSYKLYGTIHLWWLLFLLNKPKNIFYAEAGKEYKYFLPKNIEAIISNINFQVNK